MTTIDKIKQAADKVRDERDGLYWNENNNFCTGFDDASEFYLPLLREAIYLLEMKKWHEDYCENRKEKVKAHENCECGSAGIKNFLSKLESLGEGEKK